MQKFKKMEKWVIFAVAAAVRLVLLVYGEWQDANFEIKYTDIDYVVYTDASTYVMNGFSPFLRHTYRYTPLLAYFLLPNILLPCFGKLLFITSDLLSGLIISKILKLHNYNPLYVALWLLNPLVFNISTRGSSDSIASLLILLTLYYLKNKKTLLAGFIYGLAVHFRIYPLIYSLIFYFSIDAKASQFFTKNRVIFTLLSAGVFFLLILAFYGIYGYEFVYETYLYHFLRKDNRHNFSMYFYPLYLTYDNYAKWVGLLAFVPQWALIVFVSMSKLPVHMAMLSVTFVFVVFNKVCTAQYFIWYMTLLPICLPQVKMSLFKAATLVLPWVLTEVHWLYWGYRLEFLGENVFLQLWMASIMFFIANINVLTQLIKSSSQKHLKST